VQEEPPARQNKYIYNRSTCFRLACESKAPILLIYSMVLKENTMESKDHFSLELDQIKEYITDRNLLFPFYYRIVYINMVSVYSAFARK